MPTADSVDSPKSDRPARIPGSVIIMTRLIDRVPLALLHECRLLADVVVKVGD
jgi:hypothetical protein